MAAPRRAGAIGSCAERVRVRFCAEGVVWEVKGWKGLKEPKAAFGSNTFINSGCAVQVKYLYILGQMVGLSVKKAAAVALFMNTSWRQKNKSFWTKIGHFIPFM